MTATLLQAEVDCSEAEALQALYRSTGRAALSKTEYLVGRRDVAEEIVQDTFLKLWDQQPRFPNGKAAYMWIYRTCHNAGIDYLRSASHRRETPPPPGDFDSLQSACDHEDRSLKRQLIVHLTRHLSADEAAVLAYRAVDGMTQEEVAGLMDLSRKTIIRMEARIESKLATLRTAPGRGG
jgi:RNA polymerase sigma-70 factor (ECF subfamily)